MKKSTPHKASEKVKRIKKEINLTKSRDATKGSQAMKWRYVPKK